MWTAEALRAHVEDRLAAARVELSPLPHLLVAPFFPEDLYERILASNLFVRNPGRFWRSPDEMRRAGISRPYDHRLQINFHKDDPYEATPEERALWSLIRETFLGGVWFPKLVRSRFPEYFSLRFGDAVELEEFWARNRQELFLQRHEPGFHIGPHTDIPTRIFTCIFSFADRDGYESYGTQLLRPRDPFVRCWGNDHHAFEGFEVVKTAPYTRNGLLLFFKTRHSFHAVKEIGPDVPNQRWGMQYQYYEPAGGVFVDLSRPDLIQLRTDRKVPLARRIGSRVSGWLGRG